MPPRFPLVRSILPAVLLLAFTAAPALAAWPHSPAQSVTIGAGGFGTQRPVIVPDGDGGTIIIWEDAREPDYDLSLYAQHLTADGDPAPGWPAGGIGLCTLTGDQQSAAAQPDGHGGAFIVWRDFRNFDSDLFATRLTAAGVPAPGWPEGGVAVCTVPGNQQGAVLAADASGGVIIAWQDERSGPADIYATRLDSTGHLVAGWPTAVCRAPGAQLSPVIVSDGGSGAIVGWRDLRSGEADLYATHVLGGGYLDPYWPFDGYGLATFPGDQDHLAVASDGAGGALFAWQDLRSGTFYQVFANHLTGSGNLAIGWLSEGLAAWPPDEAQGAPAISADGEGGIYLASAIGLPGTHVAVQRITGAGNLAAGDWNNAVAQGGGDQLQPVITGDATGVIVSFLDRRNNPAGDIYAMRWTAVGEPAPGWPYPLGLAVSTAPGSQLFPAIAADAAGNSVVVWSEDRTGTGVIAAQRLDHYGQLGSPEPALASVRDVPNDEGGRVRVAWTASYLDAPGTRAIQSYLVLRSAPAALARQALASGAQLLESPGGAAEPGHRMFLARIEQGLTYYWELIATLPALQVPDYGYVASTTGDSIAGSNPLTGFMVAAVHSQGDLLWFSKPVAGYSVDNLAPPAPDAFSGQYAGGVTSLHWGASPAADLAGYRLYRVIGPGLAALVASTDQTYYQDAAGQPFAYLLAAVDVHGNEGPRAYLLPAGTAGVPGTDGPEVLALAPVSPNPAREEATVRWTLPAAGSTSLAVYDAGGRRVRLLASGERAAGGHTAVWDLRDEGGRPVPEGLYFVRLDAGGARLTRRVLALR